MRLVVFAIISSAVIPGAWADDRVPPVRDAATKTECGACHMAFQPGLLPAGSWTGIMDGLTDHFGEDASLPEDLAARIRAYLSAHAGRGDERVLRITEQPWWMREHRKVRSAQWNKPQVKTKSNCPACHLGAEQGSYEDEDDEF